MARRTVITPPTMRELMSDEVFKAYMKTSPSTYRMVAGEARPHPLLSTGNPWQLWVRKDTGRWRTGMFASYADVWRVFVTQFKATDTEDIAIVSRRVLMPPPGEWYKMKIPVPATPTRAAGFRYEEWWRPTFAWDAGLEWCGRCRRPSVFKFLFPDHHAIRRATVLTEDEPSRCVYCGIRRAALPVSPDTLVEA